MADYEKDEEVFILDYPFGRPLNVKGRIVGVLPDDYYNVLMVSGILEGQIKKYKYWNLFSLTRPTNDLIS